LTSDRDRAEGPDPLLVAERDERIARPLFDQLAADGYRARQARTTEHARVLSRVDPPRLVLLGELETPRAALELLVEIRGGGRLAPRGMESSWAGDLPVIVMSTQVEEPDVLRAFDAGADDFLARPPSYLQLRARLRLLLVRPGAPCVPRVEVGALAIDLHARVAAMHGRPLELRRLEYELLVHLAGEPQRVFAKQELLRSVWRYPAPVATRTLDSHASRLRRKLRAEDNEQWVINVRGVGYRLI
jgi:DNA-binding response OmpR family regulator